MSEHNGFALMLVHTEIERADGKYGPPASAAESLGVLLEEFHELREAIHQNNVMAVMREAVQVAAVAARLAAACQDAHNTKDGEDPTAFCRRSGF